MNGIDEIDKHQICLTIKKYIPTIELKFRKKQNKEIKLNTINGLLYPNRCNSKFPFILTKHAVITIVRNIEKHTYPIRKCNLVNISGILNTFNVRPIIYIRIICETVYPFSFISQCLKNPK